MSCQEVMELMQRDLDQDLTIAEQRTLLKHIRQCPECAAVFERLQRISDELEQLPAVIPPFSIVDSILPRLAEADGFREQSASSDVIPVPVGRRIGKGFSWKIGTGVAAAAAVLGLVVFNGGNIGRNDKNSTAASKMAGGYREEASTPAASQQRTMANSAMDQYSAGNEPKADVKSEETTKSLAQATPSPATGLMAEPSPTLTADATLKLQASTTPKATPGKGSGSVVLGDKNKGNGSALAGGGERPSSAASPSPSTSLSPSPGALVEPGKANPDNVVSFTPQGPLIPSGGKTGEAGSGAASNTGEEATVLAAPSNKYKAAVENQTVVVRGSNGETVFISDSQWGGGAKVHLLYWVGDTQLTYEILKPDGSKIQYLVDLSLKKEFRQ